MFDLIIANPPYGKSSSLSRKIVNELLASKAAEEIVVLAPYETFQDCYNKLLEFSPQNTGTFSDANLRSLAIGYLNKDTENDYESYTELVTSITYTDSDRKLADALLKYNESRPKVYTYISSLANTKSWKEEDDWRIFIVTVWSAQNRVHSTGTSADELHNLNKVPIKEATNANDHGFLFEYGFEHFSNWWYSNPKSHDTLIDRIMQLHQKTLGTTSAKAWEMFIPRVDWSHPWTDEEIIEELGLPKDWRIDDV